MNRLAFIAVILIILTSCKSHTETSNTSNKDESITEPITSEAAPENSTNGESNDLPPPPSSSSANITPNNNKCPSPLPENWIFCDDFEAGKPDENTYFERNLNGGNFHRTTDQAVSGNYSMEVLWDTGVVEAGNLKVTFGDAPMGAIYRSGEQFNEVYWRMHVRHQDGWQGSPDKLSRATMFVGSNWSQGMIAHLWSAGDVLLGDRPLHC